MSRAAKRARKLGALAYMVTLLWGYRLALWFLPFRQVTRLAEDRAASEKASSSEQRQLARQVERAARFVPRATCLVRVLAGAHLLAVQNRRSRIVIGVRRRAGVLEAHAWLESGGQVVLGDLQDLSSYHLLS